MKLPDLPAQHEKPLEIIHESAPDERPDEQGAGAESHGAADPHPAPDGVLRSQSGRSRSWRRPSPLRMARLPADLRLMLLAQNAGRLMGTLTVRPDSPHGLFAVRAYADEIHKLRGDGHRLGELVLAVKEGADWRAALDALAQSAYVVTRVVHALTDVVIEVNPRHVRFYFVSASARLRCSCRWRFLSAPKSSAR
jgi:hypothetical protein